MKKQILIFKRFLFVFGLCLILSLPGQNAYASTFGGVGGSKVKKGVLATELRFGYSAGDSSSAQDERLRSRVQFDYGVTDNYAARLLIFHDKRKGKNSEHEGIMMDHRFHLWDAKDYGFDFGVRAFYFWKDGDKKPDHAGIRLIEVVPFENWELRLNQFLRHDVGEDRIPGLSLELRTQATTKLNDTHRWGIESFNNFGRLRNLSGYSSQQHTIGPVLKGKIGGLGYETGYRAGISESAIDHSFKLFFKKSF